MNALTGTPPVIDDGRRCGAINSKTMQPCILEQHHEFAAAKVQTPFHADASGREWKDGKAKAKDLRWNTHPDGDSFTNGRKVPYRIARESEGGQGEVFRIYVHGVADVAAGSLELARRHCQQIEDGVAQVLPRESKAPLEKAIAGWMCERGCGRPWGEHAGTQCPKVPQTSAPVGGAEVADPPAGRHPAATVVTLLIPLEQLREDPDNVRKEYDLAELDALGENMKRLGQLQPIGVRPFRAAGQVVPEMYMVKWGHRRLRAAIRTKTIRALRAEVLDATDAEVPAQQLSENDQRDPIKALERSNAHQQMRARGLTQAQIAAATTTSEATVRDSLKLQDLVPAVKKAWAEGKLDYSRALEFAKVPGKIQPAALTRYFEAGAEENDGDPLTVRQLRIMLRNEFMLDLAKAPFPRADSQLVPTAGACGTCVHRTGAQPDMFAHLKNEPDICTNKPCFDGKVTAFLVRAEKEGRRVLNEGTAKQIFNQHTTGDYLEHNAAYVLADRSPDGRGKKTYEQLVDPKDVALVRNPATGNLLKVIQTSALPKPAKVEAPKFKKNPAQVKAEREHEIRKEAAKAARLELLEKVKKSGTDTHWLRVAIAGMVASARSDALKNVCQWRGILAGQAREEQLNDLASKLAGGELRALLFDLALAERITPWLNAGEHTQLLREACSELDVDLKKLEKEAEKELDDEREGKQLAKDVAAIAGKAKSEPIKWTALGRGKHQGYGVGGHTYKIEVDPKGGFDAQWAKNNSVTAEGSGCHASPTGTLEEAKAECLEKQLEYTKKPAKKERPRASLIEWEQADSKGAIPGTGVVSMTAYVIKPAAAKGQLMAGRANTTGALVQGFGPFQTLGAAKTRCDQLERDEIKAKAAKKGKAA